MNEKRILVYADTFEMSSPLFLGTLSATIVRGKEVFSFEYSTDWLQHKNSFEIDPNLQLYQGRHFLADEKANFGIFTDSAPDRWGRVLMDRKASLIAQKNKTNKPRLFESDYLLGVFDEHRMGALRFKLEENGDFLNNDNAHKAPPFTSLRELEQASLKIESDDISKKDEKKWLDMLIAPGSSLGGARPKASVIDPKGNLWIAKFPSKKDDTDTEAWEMLVHTLAKKCKINVAEASLKKFGKRSTFLSKRFDRLKNKRIHFASAMTLLGYSDGASDVSYLELAEFILRSCKNPNQNLKELFKRIVFSICVSNTDDHLRNHGFLLKGNEWELSPAYDITPNPNGTGLSLNIDYNKNNALDLEIPLSLAKYFNLTNKEASAIIKTIVQNVSKWKELAKEMKISRSEIAIYESAFDATKK